MLDPEVNGRQIFPFPFGLILDWEINGEIIFSDRKTVDS
jgi:hypothetical protein